MFTYLKQKQITCIVATHDSTDVLSFADEVLVLQQGAIIEKGSPKFIYENPNSLYVASLFGDVNAIEIQGKTNFVYPHQLIVVPHSDLKIIVTSSYFRGSHYLVEGQHEKGILFFDSKTDFPVEEELFLDIEITP